MLRRGGLATDFEKFLFPLTSHVARRAKGVVVHSEDSAQKFRDLAPDVPLAVIPHHAGEPPADVKDVTREQARARLDLPADRFLVGHSPPRWSRASPCSTGSSPTRCSSSSVRTTPAGRWPG
jgi:hypothetical protein